MGLAWAYGPRVPRLSTLEFNPDATPRKPRAVTRAPYNPPRTRRAWGEEVLLASSGQSRVLLDALKAQERPHDRVVSSLKCQRRRGGEATFYRDQVFPFLRWGIPALGESPVSNCTKKAPLDTHRGFRVARPLLLLWTWAGVRSCRERGMHQ